MRYAQVWKDHSTSRRTTLLTYFDGDVLATRPYDEVSRTTPPLTVLGTAEEDYVFVESWLRDPEDNTALAIPTPIVEDVLGWDVADEDSDS